MSEFENDTLNEIHKWVKFMGMQSAIEVIQDAVSDDDEEEKQDNMRTVYQLTDGDHSTRGLADMVSVSRDTVSRWQNRWASMGIVEKDSENTPYKHLISLDEVGIDYPELPEADENGGGTDD